MSTLTTKLAILGASLGLLSAGNASIVPGGTIEFDLATGSVIENQYQNWFGVDEGVKISGFDDRGRSQELVVFDTNNPVPVGLRGTGGGDGDPDMGFLNNSTGYSYPSGSGKNFNNHGWVGGNLDLDGPGFDPDTDGPSQDQAVGKVIVLAENTRDRFINPADQGRNGDRWIRGSDGLVDSPDDTVRGGSIRIEMDLFMSEFAFTILDMEYGSRASVEFFQDSFKNSDRIAKFDFPHSVVPAVPVSDPLDNSSVYFGGPFKNGDNNANRLYFTEAALLEQQFNRVEISFSTSAAIDQLSFNGLTTTPIPEPSTVAGIGMAFLGLIIFLRRRFVKRK